MAYLSNNTMGNMWLAHWCDRCIHDDGMDKLCPILGRLYLGDDDIPQLTVLPLAEDGWGPDQLTCSDFQPSSS